MGFECRDGLRMSGRNRKHHMKSKYFVSESRRPVVRVAMVRCSKQVPGLLESNIYLYDILCNTKQKLTAIPVVITCFLRIPQE